MIDTVLYRNSLTGSGLLAEFVYKKCGVLVLNRAPGRPKAKPKGYSGEGEED